LRVRVVLFGAYHSTHAPLQVRGLEVSLELELAMARWPDPASLPLRGEITAESLATGRPLRGTLALRRGEIECLVAFSDDRGAPWELRGSARLRGHAWRHSITRLEAELSGPTGRARADLRLDWHGGLRRTLGGLRVASI
jgi:hypothetical protein